jgi:hypothetical protein
MSQIKIAVQPQMMSGYTRQGLLSDERRPDPGHIAFRKIGVIFIQLIRDNGAQHGIAEVLHALIRGQIKIGVLVKI